MTEREWQTGTHPAELLVAVRGKVSYRKLRLFACGCCRRLSNENNRAGRRRLEITEKYADAAVAEEMFLAAFPLPELTGDDRQSVRYVLMLATNGLGWPDAEQPSWNYDEETQVLAPKSWEPGEYAEESTLRILPRLVNAAAFGKREKDYRATIEHESRVQAELVRDVVGNPFRQVIFDPAWRTDTVVTLARQMYESRDFFPMPILADALQDAGCENEDVLTHCRARGPHVRGCWVVDGILGKS